MDADTVPSDEDELELPFRRFDVVDDCLSVRLSGPAPGLLVPVEGRRLERKLAREVRALISERRFGRTGVGVGLIDLDYGVRILENSTLGNGYHLICTERTALRGAFERLVRRMSLNESEAELARLLMVGHDVSQIAVRLGTVPGDVERATARLLAKMRLPDRGALVGLVFPRTASRRTPRRAIGGASAEL